MNKRQGTFLGLCFSLLLVFLPVRVASAIEGGESAIGENVITMISRNLGQMYHHCSGAVIAPRLIVTAKHCFPLVNSETVMDGITDISFPGVEFGQSIATAKVLKLVTTPGAYTLNSDDLAIVVTASDLPVLGNIRLATKEDIERFRTTNPTVITYGYGSNASSRGMQKTPLKIVNKFVSNNNNIPSESFSVEYTSDASYTCGGDSGGPSYVIENDVMVYIGPTSSANREGCAHGLRGGPFRVSGSAIAFKDALLVTAQEILKEFQLKEELEAKTKAETEAKIAAEVSASLTKNKTLKVCIKGAAVKKVFGKNSKCPKGFKIRTTSVSAKSVGKGCSKAGVIAGTKKNPLVCKKVGNKLVWQRFVTASPSSLVPVSTTTIPISTTTVPSRNNCIVGGACKIGDIGPGGGTVFFDAGSLQSWGRYLEAAQKDLAVAQWDDAMAAAQAYETVGTSDWRLPTIDEIKLMFGQSQVIGNFVRSGNYQRYWTSSDVGESAWRLSMFDGSLQLRLKFFEGYWSSSVRPIRSF